MYGSDIICVWSNYSMSKYKESRTWIIPSMPALFDVPGWSVPSAPVPDQRQSKKRKRAAIPEEQDLLRTAQANFDRLIESLGDDAGPSDSTGGISLKKKTKTKHNKPQSSHDDQRKKSLHPPGEMHDQIATSVPSVNPPATSNKEVLPRKNAKKKNGKQGVPPTSRSEPSVAVQDTAGLTSLQQSLRKGLDGARFRFVLPSVEIH